MAKPTTQGSEANVSLEPSSSRGPDVFARFVVAFSIIGSLASILGLAFWWLDPGGLTSNRTVVALGFFAVLGTSLVLTTIFGIIYKSRQIINQRDSRISELQANYRKLQEERQKWRADQLQSLHEMVHHVRDLAHGNDGDVIPRQDLTPIDAAAKLANSVLDDLRNAVTINLRSSSIEVPGDLSLTFKYHISSPNARAYFPEVDNKESKENLKGPYVVVTLTRDSYTLKNRKDRKVRNRAYSIEGNTDFRLTAKEKANTGIFVCDDLKNYHSQDGYYNENQNWSRFYNATIVASVRYRESPDKEVVQYGFICIDSLNLNGGRLFERPDLIQLVSHAADLLAFALCCFSRQEQLNEKLRQLFQDRNLE